MIPFTLHCCHAHPEPQTKEIPEEKDSSKDDNGKSDNEGSAAWSVKLDTELECNREKEKCKGGKWRKVEENSELVHYPVNSRDSSFWVMTLVYTGFLSLLFD